MKLGPLAWIQIFLIVGKLIDLGNMGDIPWFWVLTPVWLSIIFLVIAYTLIGISKALRRRREQPWYEKL